MQAVIDLVTAHPFLTAYIVVSLLGHIPGMPGAVFFNKLALDLKPKADAEKAK